MKNRKIPIDYKIFNNIPKLGLISKEMLKITQGDIYIKLVNNHQIIFTYIYKLKKTYIYIDFYQFNQKWDSVEKNLSTTPDYIMNFIKKCIDILNCESRI